MIKILHIIQRLSRGGAARTLIATAKYSSRLGNFQHSVISLKPITDDYMRELAEQSNIKAFDDLDNNTLHQKIEEADIVQVHFWNNPATYEFLRSEIPSMRLLLWFHIAGDKAPQVITKHLLDHTDYAVGTSPYTLDLPVFEDFVTDGSSKLTNMVYGSSDFERLENIATREHENFNVGYIGTVDFVKMHPRYLEMSAKIDVPNIKFVVCGDGSARKILNQKAKKLKLTDKFDVKGHVEDIKSVIEQLDVLGYPLCEDNYSTSELVLQEAMYAGIPPVIFPHGGAQRSVVHEHTGLIVNNELEYKQAIEHLYHHPEERSRLGKNARDYALKYFGAENAAIKFSSIYEELMELPKRKREWGISVEANILKQPVLLEELLGKAQQPSAAELFVESLGDAAPQFKISMSAFNIDELLEADHKIARSSPVLCSKGGGGIFHYRNDYPEDGYLRLWSGLVLQEQGQVTEAIAEFNKAVKLGCDHWRVSWYIAQAQAKLTEEALQQVTKSVPGFTEATQMLNGLSGKNEVTSDSNSLTLESTKSKTGTRNVTIFAIPKAFKDHIGVIQRNAVISWTKLEPRPEIILFGEDEGTAEIAEEFNLRYVPKIKCNEFATPLLSDIFAQAQQLATNDVVTYVNSDMIMLQDFIEAVEQVSGQYDEYMMIGRRWNLDVTKLIAYQEQNWSDKLLKFASEAGHRHSVHGKDYFTFPKNLFAEIPEFAVGRAAWDNWMVHEALSRKYAVIDATQGILAIHQNHDYAHLKGGKLESSRGKEAEKNKVAGGYNFQGTIADCTRQYIPVSTPNKPRISIIIPTYNQSSTIGLAIESVLNQTYTDYEIIVVDNNSTDNTREVLQPYFPYIRYIPQNHQGILQARNRGIESSQSELVGFLNADSFFLPNKLEEQIALFDKRGSLELVHSGWKIIASDEIKTIQPWKHLPSLNPDEIHIWKTWKLWERFPASAIVFRRTHLNLLNGFNTELHPKVAEIDIILRSALKGGLGAWLQKPTYCDRQEDAKQDLESIVLSFELILNNFFTRPELPEWVSLLNSQAKYNNSVWLAWMMHYYQNQGGLQSFLHKSLDYSPYKQSNETRLDWQKKFALFSQEYDFEQKIDMSFALEN